MPSFEDIYAGHADQYDALVSHEDYQGHLLPALNAIRPLDGLSVVEMGAGTGRLTRLIAPQVRHVRAYDLHAHMLETAAVRLKAFGIHNVTLEPADNAQLPAETASADLAIAGWSFGHSVSWAPDRWREVIGAAVGEMLRVLRPDGTAVILETLGTGRETPVPPHDGLAAYYAWLEQDHGFTRTWVRTDFRFESLDVAERLMGFFFGPAMGGWVRQRGDRIVPECTGIWHRPAVM